MDSLEFSILRPWWLLFLLLPLVFVYIDFGRHYKLQNFIREDIINFLKPKKTKKKHTNEEESAETAEEAKQISKDEAKALIAKPKLWKKYGWLIFPYFCAVFALSGPAITQERSLFQTDENWVWVLDTSYSMLANDLEPSRFQRAKNSLVELLNSSKNHRRISIIAYAGDNYLITPPTDDVSTLLFNLNEIDPTIMPVPGSEPLPALNRAISILDNDKEIPGNILFITDDIKDQSEAEKLTNLINESKYPIYIYAIGTTKGSPVKINNEILSVKDASGNPTPVMATSHLNLIQKVAEDSNSKVFFEVDNNGEAPNLAKMYSYEHPKYFKTDKSKYLKKDIGYYLLIGAIIAVFALFRNYYFVFIFAALISLGSSMLPQEAMAADSLNIDPVATPKKYGYYLYTKGKYEEALKYFEDEPRWKGNTLYRLGRYADAIIAYQALGNDADAKYNIGNCYAFLSRNGTPNALDNALLAYEQALKIDPNHANANQNRTIILNYKEQEDKTKQRTITIIDEATGKQLKFNENDILVTPEEKTSLMKRRLLLQQSKKTVQTKPEQIW